MGLAGGPHCLGMCAAPCAGVLGAARHAQRALGGGGSGAGVIPIRVDAAAAQPMGAAPAMPGTTAGAAESARDVGDGGAAPQWAFQAGRLLGYSALGALAATAMDSLAWLTAQSGALRPVWTLMHAAVLAWGVMLLVLGRQPVWAGRSGQSLWVRLQVRLRPWLARREAPFLVGLAWALLPCGLLYSALLVAALSNDAVSGALCMAAFATGSGAALVVAPWLWQKAQAFLGIQAPGRERLEALGTRLAGLTLIGLAVWALWHDAVHRFLEWCGVG